MLWSVGICPLGMCWDFKTMCFWFFLNNYKLPSSTNLMIFLHTQGRLDICPDSGQQMIAPNCFTLFPPQGKQAQQIPTTTTTTKTTTKKTTHTSENWYVLVMFSSKIINGLDLNQPILFTPHPSWPDLTCSWADGSLKSLSFFDW